MRRLLQKKLDAEHRQYVKPMRYDASISEVFPWLHLLDTKSDKPFPMEAFGMATPAYLARKQLKKKDYYNREYGPYGWWHWDATTASETMVLPHFSRITQTSFNWHTCLKWRKMSYMLSFKRTDKTERFPVRILDDYKTGVITRYKLLVESVTCFLLWKVETQKGSAFVDWRTKTPADGAECPQKFLCAEDAERSVSTRLHLSWCFSATRLFWLSSTSAIAIQLMYQWCLFRDSLDCFLPSGVASSFITLVRAFWVHCFVQPLPLHSLADQSYFIQVGAQRLV